MAPHTTYRSTNIIIQTILEGILRAFKDKRNPRKGIIKSHLIEYCALKTSTAEKYFNIMEQAGYISSHEEHWGERVKIIYEITPKGRERYEWFIKINTELGG
ncbi:MAG: hypothetical protein ACFFDF_24640 [Candidatus Odinarchaeota archaeon]